MKGCLCIAAMAGLACAVVSGCAGLGVSGRAGGPDGSPGRVGVGDHMPDISVASLAGQGEIRIASFAGRLVVLDLWASWCEPCREELPLLDNLARRLKSRGIEFIAVAIDQNRADAESFLDFRRTWELTLAHDPQGAIADRMQPTTMPSSYVIDRAGIVRAVNAGFVRGDERKIEDLLLDLLRDYR